MMVQIRGNVLYIPEGIEEIGFHEIHNIKQPFFEVHLPSTLKIIHEDTFFDCAEIRKVHIPQSVQEIGTQAFWGMDELEEILLPQSVKMIGKHAFCNCPNLMLSVVGHSDTIPNGWHHEFSSNIKGVCFVKDLSAFFGRESVAKDDG